MQTDILEKLEKLVDEKKIKLLFPEIILDEVYRNVPEQIAIYSKKIACTPLTAVLPDSVKKGDTYKAAEIQLKQYNDLLQKLQKEYQESMGNMLKTIERLMEKSENIRETQTTIDAANLRRLKGNPPFPSDPTDPIGDSIAWELMLSDCAKQDEDIIILSEDAGWRNSKEGKKSTPHPFLVREWGKKSKKDIRLYVSLSDFMKSEFPRNITQKDIELNKKASIPQGTFIVGSLQGLAGSASTPPISSWQPISASGTFFVVNCVNCGKISLSSDCVVTGRGYYCRACYSSAGTI